MKVGVTTTSPDTFPAIGRARPKAIVDDRGTWVYVQETGRYLLWAVQEDLLEEVKSEAL